jgi:RNA recognition motif-containing protein
MGTDHNNVLSVNGYLVLKIRLPSSPSFRESAWHYLYLRRHEPKIPGPDDERTLFIVNIPVDSTEAHFRSLFARLGGAKIESVQLDRSRPIISPKEVAVTAPKARPNKRKRKRGKVDDEDRKESKDAGDLPEVWDRQLLQSGSSGLIVFSDKTGLIAVLKAVKRGQGTKLAWGEGVDQETVAVLGSHSKAHHPFQAESCLFRFGPVTC